jgi:methionyl-tRNA formyltransferase
MRIGFFGTPAYAVPTLNALIAAGHEIVTVVAQPDAPSGRGHKLRPPAVVVRARELGLETRQPRGVRRGLFATRFPQLTLDVGVVVAYGRILPKPILDTPALGCINAHGSLLPRWRGAAPIERAILAGDTLTGVCTMQMDEGLDTGPVLLRRETAIDPDETAAELRARLSEISAELVVETLTRLSSITATPQPETGVSYAAMLTRDETVLDFSRPARALHDQVRAFSPKPGGTCTFRGDRFKIRRSRVLETSELSALSAKPQGPPGTVWVARKRLIVVCGQGALEVLEGQMPGRSPLPGGVLANGARIEVGEVLT